MRILPIQLQKKWARARLKASELRILQMHPFKFSCLNSFFNRTLTGPRSAFSYEHSRCRTLWKLFRNGFERFCSTSSILNKQNKKFYLFLKLFNRFIENWLQTNNKGVECDWIEVHFFGSDFLYGSDFLGTSSTFGPGPGWQGGSLWIGNGFTYPRFSVMNFPRFLQLGNLGKIR